MHFIVVDIELFKRHLVSFEELRCLKNEDVLCATVFDIQSLDVVETVTMICQVLKVRVLCEVKSLDVLKVK